MIPYEKENFYAQKKKKNVIVFGVKSETHLRLQKVGLAPFPAIKGARGVVHPGQVVSPSQDQHADKQPWICPLASKVRL